MVFIGISRDLSVWSGWIFWLNFNAGVSRFAVVQDEVDVDLIENLVDRPIAGVAVTWSRRLNFDTFGLLGLQVGKSFLELCNSSFYLEDSSLDSSGSFPLAKSLEFLFELSDLSLNVLDLDVVSVENDGLLGFDRLDLSKSFNVVLSGLNNLLFNLLLLSFKQEFLGINLVVFLDKSLASSVVWFSLALL